MTSNQFNDMLTNMARGWSDRDYEAVTCHFSETVFYGDPLNYTIRDRESLLGFFRDDEGKPQSCELHGYVFDEDRQTGTAEYTYEGTFRYHGTVWIDLEEDKIVRWREYQHRSDKDFAEFWNG